MSPSFNSTSGIPCDQESCGQEQPARLPSVAIRYRAVDSVRENLHRLATSGYDCAVAIRYRAVDSVREKLHRLATGGYDCEVAIGRQAVDSGARKTPPSGDRWLRLRGSHPLPSGGRRRENSSTVWRQVATIAR